MKLLVTTAAAALLSAGIALAEGDTAAADVNAAAQAEITTDTANTYGGAHAGATVHGLADLDTDASGNISLEEAQAFDPSVSDAAFAEFDTDSDAMLDEAEYSAWAAEMDSSAMGQGDADADAVGADTEAELSTPETPGTPPADGVAVTTGADADNTGLTDAEGGAIE